MRYVREHFLADLPVEVSRGRDPVCREPEFYAGAVYGCEEERQRARWEERRLEDAERAAGSGETLSVMIDARKVGEGWG